MLRKWDIGDSSHHCTSKLRALSSSQDFGMHLWDYFSGSVLNKIRVSPSTCGWCFVTCLADGPNWLFLKSTELLLPRGWSNKVTFALSWHCAEWYTADYAIRGEIERNCMLVSHSKCRLDSVVLHVHLVLHKKTRKQLHHDYTYFKTFYVNTVCSQRVLTLDPPQHLHMAEASTAVPGSAYFSTTESPQPCSGCPNFTESIIPAHGYTCYPTRGIYLRHSWWNKWENWLKQEKLQG